MSIKVAMMKQARRVATHTANLGLLRPSATSLSQHQLRCSSTTPAKKDGLWHRILHGNRESQEEIAHAVETREVNFSQKIARGKYIHDIMTHDVKPECVDEYLALLYTRSICHNQC